MDWPNERYVRFYTRRTADDLMLRWEARVLWPHLLAIADRAGLIRIHHQGERRTKALALLLDAPMEFVRLAMPELLEDGRIREVDAGYIIPNYIEAQEARSSDSSRQRKRRERRRDQAMAGPVTKRDDVSRNVTAGHAALPDVTSGHAASHPVTPSLAVPYLAVPTSSLPSSAPHLRVVPVAPEEEVDQLEPEEPSPTAAELRQLWQDARARWDLGLEANPARVPDEKRLRYGRSEWAGAFDAYLDPNRSKGLQAAQDDWPLAALLAGSLLARKAPKRAPRRVLCGSCGGPASLNGAGQPIRTAGGKATCYPCVALATSVGGGA